MHNRSRTRTYFRRAIPALTVVILGLLWATGETADQPGANLKAHPAKTPSAGKPESPAVPTTDGAPATLDQALAKALENHPDIVAAKAKLQLAEAELKRTRMEVARKVVAIWNDRQAQEKAAMIVREHFGSGRVPQENMIAAQASLAQSQAELRYLTGQVLPAALRSAGTATAARPPQMPSGPIAERVREALGTPTQIQFTDDSFDNVLDYLQDFHRIEIQRDSKALQEDGIAIGKDKVSVNIQGVPLVAALQLIEDRYPPMKFVVRDYGILVTTAKRAEDAGFFPAVEYARLSGKIHAPWDPLEPSGPPTRLPATKPNSTPKSQPQPK